MKKIYPEKFRKGDTIRIIAPSRSLNVISKDNQKIAIENLEAFGLKVEFGKNVPEEDDFRSSSIESRIEDLHDAFRDSNVKGIIAAIGGFNSNQLLKYIDWELVKTNPKIFCGYSDITALSNGIYSKTGLVNYSGPSFSTFGKIRDNKYTIDYYKKCLFCDNPIELEPSKTWDNRDWWKDQNNSETFENDGWRVIQEGEATGTIIGGNLCTLNLLQGTEFMPQFDGSILFIEDDYESNALNFDRDLQSLIHLPDFHKVKAIVIGRFEVASKVTNTLLDQVIKTKKELRNIPVISGVDFGHTSPMITFPIGGEVEISASRDNPSIKIIKH